jgi:hypothetical protein
MFAIKNKNMWIMDFVVLVPSFEILTFVRGINLLIATHNNLRIELRGSNQAFQFHT